ncbi:hypothetical protein [Mycobacterium sp. E3251]|uniref:hypothetical protein n=1 Tax=Mycobacterium sp. E3251 TaxID=1834144 RepID=UPI000A453559|nr:hypothetical protein [Mycobacterium sp. E3251]
MAENFSTEGEYGDFIAHYNLWRKIANNAGDGPYDEAERQGDRLYFRSDYSRKVEKWPEWAEQGDWGAWIIARTQLGYFSVLSSLKHERASQRDEEVRVLFSTFSDAGKYIIMRVADSARVSLRLQTQFVKWNHSGLDPRIAIEAADPDVINLLKSEYPGLEEGFAEQYLKRYTLTTRPDSYGFAFPEDEPRMQVLLLSFEELTEALLEGIPEDIALIARSQDNGY